MKARILMLLIVFPVLGYGQTQGRSDAVLEGNARQYLFKTVAPVN